MSRVVTWINPIIIKACVSYGFLHLVKNWLQSVILLLFVNNTISTLTFNATQLGLSLPICASNSDTGGVYSPFWTSSYCGLHIPCPVCSSERVDGFRAIELKTFEIFKLYIP